MSAPRPTFCCGKCPPIVGGGYGCTCPDNPRCKLTQPNQTLVEQEKTMTNLEQLAALIESERTWTKRMSDGYTSAGQNSPEHIAQAIIDAGWTPPEEIFKP